jgi:hypothetical protein
MWEITLFCSASVSQPPHKRHNTSPKYKEHKQGENAITYIQANKTHTSIQNREEPQRNTFVVETHLQTITTPRQNMRKTFYIHLILILIM